jgi:hypothetical protein
VEKDRWCRDEGSIGDGDMGGGKGADVLPKWNSGISIVS